MRETQYTKLILISYGILMMLFFNITAVKGQTISSSVSLPGEISGRSDDTVRVDPLNGFKKYRGGYDITNKHYWSSTVFTGIYGYAFGVVWLVAGLLYGGFVLATTCCCKNSKEEKPTKPINSSYRKYYLWPHLLVIFFTVLAIAASGLVLGGNVRFHSQARNVVNIIIGTANEASETIYNTTEALDYTNHNLAASNAISAEASSFLTSTSERLDSQAADLQREAKKNRHLISTGLRIVHIITIVTISFNLVAVIALSVSGYLRIRRAIYLLLILCWFLTSMCWILFGMHFFLDKFAGDTCTALDNFQRNPNNNSLSAILPCDKLRLAKSVLFDVSAGIYQIVNEVNANISVLRETSYPNLVYVCNPFSAPPEYEYQPDNCPINTVRIGDIPKVLKIFTCSDANDGTCQGGLISHRDYQTVQAYTSSIQSILNAYPGMENLLECQIVRDAFARILREHCKPVKRYVRMVWIACLFLSLVMVALVSLWIAKTHFEQNNHLPDTSVKPHYTMDSMESTTAKEIL